jgi:type III secretory pathway lipoprotein EscJ
MNISHEITVGDITSYPSNVELAVEVQTDPKSRHRNLRRWLSGIFLLLPLFLTSCSTSTSLATVATEEEAIAILNVLHENGIDAHKEEVGEEGARRWKIALDPSWFAGSSEVAMANQVLQDNGLPRPTYSGAPVSDGGMFKDEATRKAEQLKEREADLQKKLRLLPGVVGVEVSIVEPEDSSININAYPSTAAVLVVSKDDPPNFDQGTIKGLVARSVPKLSADNVYVAITTKPAKPLPWAEIGSRRRHKILDAVGIGIMIILASSLVVLLLQSRRQNRDFSSRRDPQTEPSADNSLTTDPDFADRNAGNETTTLEPSANTGVAPTAI